MRHRLAGAAIVLLGVVGLSACSSPADVSPVISTKPAAVPTAEPQAPVVQPPTKDETYLSVVRERYPLAEGLQDSTLIDVAKASCDALDSGVSWSQVLAAVVAEGGDFPDVIGFAVGAGVQTYCPEHTRSIGEAWSSESAGGVSSAAPRPVDQGASRPSGRDAYNTPCDSAPDPNNCTDPVCVSTGNPSGVCWYDGFQFPNRTVCIEASANSSWTQATAETALNWVANQWAVNGLRIYVRSTQWGCSAAGFAARQIVYYQPYNAADGNCGLSYSMGAGYTSNSVAINMRADYAANCRSGGFWNHTWGHEFGHQIGLSHTAEGESIMRYGLSRSSIDAWKVANLYTGNPCGDPLYAGCV